MKITQTKQRPQPAHAADQAFVKQNAAEHRAAQHQCWLEPRAQLQGPQPVQQQDQQGLVQDVCSGQRAAARTNTASNSSDTAALVLLRKAAHVLAGGSYTFGAWPQQWFYEFFKDIQTYALRVSAVHGSAWFARRRVGEAGLLAAPDEGVPVAPVEHPPHFLVRKLGKEFLVATADIEYAQAAGNYVNLRVRGHDYPLRVTMAVLETRLDPAVFLRAHRSWLVNRRCLVSIEPLEGGEAVLHMADGGAVPCSRRQLPVVREALGADHH